MEPGRYLARIGVDGIEERSVETLERLQQAHVRTVPFENLAIVGDPVGDDDGEGVTLSVPALFEKVVERERGGYCFELNGLFGWLLAALGFDRQRTAACVLDEDGTVDTPANHHTNVVSLDRRYLVDVGLAIPALRRPLPLDGGSRTDGAGITWRLVESDRPDADFLGQYRTPGDGWTDRFVFRDRPRELSYFAASCEYLANAPESAFTGEPLVTIATDDGHYKLTRETLVFAREDERQTERPVADDEYHDTLESVFGLSV